MTYDPANRKDIRRAEKATARDARTSAEVVVTLCAEEPGRRWVWNELSACHVFTTSFSPDPLSMSFAEGERNRGLQLLAQVMEFCPRQFTLMMEEANVRRTAAATERAGREGAGRDAEPGGDAIDDDGPSDYDGAIEEQRHADRRRYNISGH